MNISQKKTGSGFTAGPGFLSLSDFLSIFLGDVSVACAALGVVDQESVPLAVCGDAVDFELVAFLIDLCDLSVRSVSAVILFSINSFILITSLCFIFFRVNDCVFLLLLSIVIYAEQTDIHGRFKYFWKFVVFS